MTVRTLGTNATTSLANAIQFAYGNAGTAAAFGFSNEVLPADLFTVANAIKDDLINPPNRTFPGALHPNGLLVIPNRGIVKVLPGDWIGVDSQGWPILVSANSIANAAWTHSAT